MRALIYEGPWHIAVRDCRDPALPEGDQVLVRVCVTGICGTDLRIISGRYPAVAPLILGHESCGIVSAVGNDVRRIAVGDRVVINPTYFCGTCFFCETGRPNHCERKIDTETGVSSPGTLATFFTTREPFVHRIPDGISFDEAVLTEPLSCVLTGARQLRQDPRLRVAVLGAGPIGMLYASAISTWAPGGVVVEVSDARRRFAATALGETWKICGDLDGARRITPYYDIVVDTTCQLADALAMVDRGGQYLAVGLQSQRAEIDLGDLANRSVSIIGSIDSIHTFDDALALIAEGRIPTAAIVTNRVSLEELPDALSLLGLDIRHRTLAATATAGKLVVSP